MVRATSYLVSVVAAVIMFALTVSGCSPPVRHKVLTFFFTGVPEPGAVLASDGSKTTARAEAAGTGKKKRRTYVQEPGFFVHGPYAARECGKCHAADSSSPFQFGGAKTNKSAQSKKTNYGPRLAYPLDKLCITCHNEKSNSVAKSLQLVMHKPVADGECIRCHDQHRSARQYMLRGKDSVELCSTACHAKGKFLATAAHKKDPKADCLDCHNPHMGKTTRLLKVDFDEWQLFDGGG